jgi:hypothetical protein
MKRCLFFVAYKIILFLLRVFSVFVYINLKIVAMGEG